MKVLLILDHAPDYRESFCRQLGKMVDLTVVAQPCEPDGLSSPSGRKYYRFIELPYIKILGMRWQPGVLRILKHESWDVVCVALNLRQLARIFAFACIPKSRGKWLWSGHIYGRRNAKALNVIRKYLLSRAAGCLTYSEPIARRVSQDFSVKAVSFNNTEISASEFRAGYFGDHQEVRLLFVGRNQPRKCLDRLVMLAMRREDVKIRIVGPEADRISIPDALRKSNRVEVFGRTVDAELNEHFDWADIVANPGHVGLLVMNAARHGKGIVIDRDSEHAPEYWLAKEADQPFISFSDPGEVDKFVHQVRCDRLVVKRWARNLQSIAREKYTIEAMVAVHVSQFYDVANRNRY